jgi:hypothetical protein
MHASLIGKMRPVARQTDRPPASEVIIHYSSLWPFSSVAETSAWISSHLHHCRSTYVCRYVCTYNYICVLSIRQSTQPPILLSLCLPIWISGHLPVCLSVCICLPQQIYLSNSYLYIISIYPCLSIHPSTYLTIYLCVRVCVYIFTCYWLDTGFRLIIGFIGGLKLVTTNNYNCLTNSHTPQITTYAAHIKFSILYLIISRCYAVASNNGDPSRRTTNCSIATHDRLTADSEVQRSELLYHYQFTANQFVLTPSPWRIFLQLNSCGHSPYVATTLTKGLVLTSSASQVCYIKTMAARVQLQKKISDREPKGTWR